MNYKVFMDITVSKIVYVDAESDEQAKAKALEKVEKDPFYYAANADGYAHAEVEDWDKDDDDETTSDSDKNMKKAIQYVRENMDEDDRAILKAEVSKCYKMHLVANESLVDCTKVMELLSEYGEENDLPEDWWEEECDMAELLLDL